MPQSGSFWLAGARYVCVCTVLAAFAPSCKEAAFSNHLGWPFAIPRNLPECSHQEPKERRISSVCVYVFARVVDGYTRDSSRGSNGPSRLGPHSSHFESYLFFSPPLTLLLPLGKGKPVTHLQVTRRVRRGLFVENRFTLGREICWGFITFFNPSQQRTQATPHGRRRMRFESEIGREHVSGQENVNPPYYSNPIACTRFSFHTYVPFSGRAFDCSWQLRFSGCVGLFCFVPHFLVAWFERVWRAAAKPGCGMILILKRLGSVKNALVFLLIYGCYWNEREWVINVGLIRFGFCGGDLYIKMFLFDPCDGGRTSDNEPGVRSVWRLIKF